MRPHHPLTVEAMMRSRFEACCRSRKRAAKTGKSRVEMSRIKSAGGLDKPTFLRLFALAGEALERHGLQREDGNAMKRFFVSVCVCESWPERNCFSRTPRVQVLLSQRTRRDIRAVQATEDAQTQLRGISRCGGRGDTPRCSVYAFD